MNLHEIDERGFEIIDSAYRRAGMVVLQDVQLPSTLEPRRSELVFLEVRGACEVYLDAGVAYLGPDPGWRSVMAQPPEPGGARRLVDGQPGIAAALDAVLGALDQAEPPQRLPVAPTPRERGDMALVDLVEQARGQAQRPTYIGRERELRALATNLLRETKPGVVIVGPAGVGKTTLVRMLAAFIAWQRDLPEGLAGAPIYELPLGAVLEEVHVVGDLERRLRSILEQPGRPIFFLDELHQLTRPELAPIKDLLKPALAEGSLRVIGASTVVEWGRVRDRAFQRRFMELRLAEPSAAETHRMLGPRSAQLAAHHGLRLHDGAVREAVMLADRYLPGRSFPDKAIDLLDHAAALQRAAEAGPCGEPPDPTLGRTHLLEATAAQSGLPRLLLDPETSAELAACAVQRLRARLRGQDASFAQIETTLAARIAQRLVGWPNALATLEASWDRRPLACLLACGPTGVGKTETARVLADVFFEGRLIVLNGSDVGPEARHGVSMWTGSPPGYVGSDQGGVLTTGLRTHGTAVILIDELEKASLEAVQNVLLPLLGEGTVTDRNTGEALCAADCIVFCTSNIEPESGVQRSVGLGFGANETNSGAISRQQAEALQQALRKALRPEILGRFHALLAYQDLDRETAWRVFEDQLEDLGRQIGNGARIELDRTARELVATELSRLNSGARGIQGLVRERVLPLLVGQGPGVRVLLTARDGQLELSRQV